jgi:soluble cytochrome b562
MMHSTLILCALSTLVLGFLPNVFATVAEEDVPAVVQNMRDINKGFRTLRRQIDDTDQKDENLKLIAQIRADLVAASKEEPLKTPELPASERDAFLKGYRQLMDSVLAEMDKLKAAVSAGNNAEAKSLLRQINELKKQGHGKYQKEE